MAKSVHKRWSRKNSFACSTHSSNSWRSLPRSIEPDDLKRLLRKRFTPRDKCMILVLLRTGMRICELLALKLTDLNLKQRTILISESAKTGVGRVVYISDDALKALKKWIKERDPKAKFLFHSHKRGKMSSSTVAHWRHFSASEISRWP